MGVGTGVLGLGYHDRSLAITATETVTVAESNCQLLSRRGVPTNGGLISSHSLMISSVNYQNKSKFKKYGSSTSSWLITYETDIKQY